MLVFCLELLIHGLCFLFKLFFQELYLMSKSGFQLFNTIGFFEQLYLVFHILFDYAELKLFLF